MGCWAFSLPAGFIEPCVPTAASVPPSGPGWLHEIKHDGYRLMARLDGRGERLFSRRGHEWSGRFPRISEALASLRARSVTIDGEAVVLCSKTGLSPCSTSCIPVAVIATSSCMRSI